MRNTRFNTASGKCCCNNNMERQLLYPVTGFNTASGKCCCNNIFFNLVNKPLFSFNTASGKCCCNASRCCNVICGRSICFNTASGKCCCNLIREIKAEEVSAVSIPQAVSAVATFRWRVNF